MRIIDHIPPLALSNNEAASFVKVLDALYTEHKIPQVDEFVKVHMPLTASVKFLDKYLEDRGLPSYPYYAYYPYRDVAENLILNASYIRQFSGTQITLYYIINLLLSKFYPNDTSLADITFENLHYTIDYLELGDYLNGYLEFSSDNNALNLADLDRYPDEDNDGNKFIYLYENNLNNITIVQKITISNLPSTIDPSILSFLEKTIPQFVAFAGSRLEIDFIYA